jgi:hypothetical protein
MTMAPASTPRSIVPALALLVSLAALGMSALALYYSGGHERLADDAQRLLRSANKRAGESRASSPVDTNKDVEDVKADAEGDLERMADEAKQAQESYGEDGEDGAARRWLDRFRLRLDRVRRSAGPALSGQLDDLGRRWEEASEGLRKRASDVPERLSQLSESAKKLAMRRVLESPSEEDPGDPDAEEAPGPKP